MIWLSRDLIISWFDYLMNWVFRDLTIIHLSRDLFIERFDLGHFQEYNTYRRHK